LGLGEKDEKQKTALFRKETWERKMKNKKAWLRIFEAFVAILLVLGVLIVMVTRSYSNKGGGESIQETQRFILEQISANDELRKDILQENNAHVNETIVSMIPSHWNFETRICNLSAVCGMSNYIEKDVYADEILITGNLTFYNPKKLRLFVWMK